jgi:O-antigen/teichoic acid export membrane protein
VDLRRAIGDFANLAVGHGAAKAIGFVSTILLARFLPTEDVALYAILLTALGYMQAMANWGSDAIGIRSVASQPDGSRGTASVIARFRLFTGGLIALLAVVLALALGVPAACLPPLLLCILVLAYRRDWLLLGRGQTRRVGFALAIREVTFLLCTVVVTRMWPSVAVALWGVLAAELLWTLASATLYRASGPPAEGRSELGLRDLAIQGLPIAIVSVTVLTNNKIDVPLLAHFRGSAEVASYWGAYNVLFAAMALAALLTRAALPHMSREASKSQHEGSAGAFRLSVLSAMAGCAVGLILIAMAGPIMGLLYSHRFDDGASPLRILALALPGHFLAAILVGRLVAEKRQHLWTVAAVSAAGTNLGLNLFLIPRLGALGAAWSTVCSEWLLCAVIVFSFRRHPLHRALLLNASWLLGCFLLQMIILFILWPRMGLPIVALATATTAVLLLLPALQLVPSTMRLSAVGRRA